ncbi:MAG: hypothetical protein N3B17_01395 [Chlorobi bacterium]|nr:hypothetical protein [Chlorobiota bacterium]
MRLLLLAAVAATTILAQEPIPGRSGRDSTAGEVVPPDTVFVFSSPRPLIAATPGGQRSTVWGLQILFSQSGFGAGFFVSHALTEQLALFADIGASGARNSSEIETMYDPITGRLLVPGKINRLFIFPMTVGVQHRLFSESLGETMRPFAIGGFGPTLVVSTPYEYEFFQSWSYARGYVRFGAFVGVGTFIGPPSRGEAALQVRYYYIPFGGAGLESIRGQPIKDFGGIFLTFAVGFN